MKELEEWLMKDPIDREIMRVGFFGFGGHKFEVCIKVFKRHPAFGYGDTISEAAINAIAAEKAENG